jgi:hypothetical protein
MKRAGNLLTSGLTLGLGVFLLNGCAGNSTVAQPANQVAPQPLEAAKQPVAKAIETPPLEGKVVETMNAGGYTYISLEKDGKKGWIAVPATEVTVGQEIKVKPGMEMGLFSSKTLKRSFDNITFSPGIDTGATSQPAKAQPTAEGEMKLPAGHKAVDKNAKPRGMAAVMNAPTGGEAKGDLSGKVVETMDAGGYTYINLEKDGKQTWAAVPTMKVTVGEEMELQPGAVMTNFTSKSLNKTFESVVFSGGSLHGK